MCLQMNQCELQLQGYTVIKILYNTATKLFKLKDILTPYFLLKHIELKFSFIEELKNVNRGIGLSEFTITILLGPEYFV